MTLYSDRRDSINILTEIDSRKSDYLIIHYACESFYVENGKSSRIICIAIRQLDDGQTTMFSINQMAELHHISYKDIEDKYDELEKLMLDKFFFFLSENKHKKWLHWSMRDNNYGFKAIEHRYSVLGGQPNCIPDSHKIDLSWLLVKIYGKNYAPKSKMQNLMLLNNIQQRDFLSGEDEANAIEKSEYIKVNMSTASKVELFSHYFSLAIDSNLKTENKLTVYGNTIKGKFLVLRQNLFFKLFLQLIIGLFWICFGLWLEKYISF
ncbi:hypothetical protein LP21_03150 [Listeria monocytogenes]|nr:hypothetical protein [Listeria monocytogenes]EAD0294091.1 hypothetical protein [Listeria monocytogenes]